LAKMEAAGMDEFVPHCRLSLAYAHLLVGNFSEAIQNIAASEAVFATQGDQLNQARCWQHRASALRRQGKNEDAILYLQQALDVFGKLGALVDLAKAQHILAYCQFYLTGHYQTTEALFKEAAKSFHEQDLPLWEAQSVNGLAHMYMETGKMDKAREALRSAQETYSQCSETTLYSDCLVDSGRLEMFWGNREASLKFLERAKHISTACGSKRLAAIAEMYLGLACSQFNNFQRALNHLESAQDYFLAHNDLTRLPECNLHLAQTWSRLGHLDGANKYLREAANFYRTTSRKDLLAATYLQQAEALFLAEHTFEAIASLQEALSLSLEQGERTLIALSHRLLGEALLAQNQSEQAYEHILAAIVDYEALSMPIEKAASQVALGEYYAQTKDFEEAKQTWKKALDLCKDIAPDIAWRLYARSARLAEQMQEAEPALDLYRHMVTSLIQVRHNFRQPSLLGSYLQQPAQDLDSAVALAAQMDSKDDALRFIEESKAQTLVAQFIEPRFDHASENSPLKNLTAEIRWLQERIRGNGQSSPTRLLTREQATWIRQLRRKNQQYDEWIGRLERQRIPGQPLPDLQASLSSDQLQAHVNNALEKEWMALDYYLSEDYLIVITLTHDEIQVHKQVVTGPVRLALQSCASVLHRGQKPSHDELAILGSFLFPKDIHQRLDREVTLLISPHRSLHQIPWSAIPFGKRQQPLVASCIPVIIPSIYIMTLLLKRIDSVVVPRRNGLILAVSNFERRRPPLPNARMEADLLGKGLETDSHCLLDSDANWENILALAKEKKLDSFSFWHIATHAFHDPQTGRLSGIALSDGDLWLDRISELAPLPHLVTLSACSGLQSRLYEGDESIGLATTCLASGAQQVVASLWPVRDDRAVGLMMDFYENWWSGQSPARALALSQRAAAVEYGNELNEWSSFLCFGAPDVVLPAAALTS
jgi:CHAT domain-containing protein